MVMRLEAEIVMVPANKPMCSGARSGYESAIYVVFALREMGDLWWHT